MEAMPEKKVADELGSSQRTKVRQGLLFASLADQVRT